MPAPARPRTGVRTAALLTALSLVLSGCSSSDTPEATASPSTGHQGPLTEYLAPVDEVLTGEEAQLTLDIEIQEGVATCMAEAGFDYIPYIAPKTIHLEVSDKGTRDWVARVGYGLSGGMMEGPEREAWIASGAANAARPPSVNPNDAIYAQLSEGTKAAYDLARNGPPLTEDDERDESTPWSRADGCYTWAAFVQHADRDAARFADFADLGERMYATSRDLDTQPRMVDLTTEWAHCMADVGHVYISPTDAWESVSAVIQGTPGPDGDPYITSDEVKALEIAVALADYDCKEAVDWETVRNSVIDEVEAQFLADNKAEIDEFIAAVLQSSREK